MPAEGYPMVVKVAINGYGTIGKRVADAVTQQDDMEIVGVTKTRPTVEAHLAVKNGFPLYGAHQEAVEKFKAAGLPVQGTLDDLLAKADIVIDCTPGKMGDQYKAIYQKAHDQLHARIGDELLHNIRSRTRDDVQHSRRQSRSTEDFGNLQADHRGLL